ncbi:MAG: hypothetical protein JW723_06490 [Bacteroidales bacterium]|nr:hypothetical protein [Bacteroidales bacterium]
MNSFTRNTGIIMLFMLVISCSTFQITKISVLMPGEIEFPSDVHHVSLALLKNENNMPAGRIDHIDNMELDPEFNYYQYAREYLYGLQTSLQESPIFERIKISRLDNYDSLGYEPEFDWREIIRICRHDTTDALILIDDFRLDDSLKVSDWLAGYYVEYELKNTMSFHVLNPRMQQITARNSFSNENSWIGLEISLESALDQMPAGEDMILQSCYETGLKAGRSMAPVWNNDIRRIYYLRGNKLLARGASFARKDMWREAANYWRMAAGSNKDRISAKASFNMALACEIEDKLELAREWIGLSDSIRSTEFSMLYQQIIKTRLEYQKVLDKQMGFEE